MMPKVSRTKMKTEKMLEKQLAKEERKVPL